jgi:hypothetical protein
MTLTNTMGSMSLGEKFTRAWEPTLLWNQLLSLFHLLVHEETQPMIPAHDCSALHVFAGTWQSPANL